MHLKEQRQSLGEIALEMDHARICSANAGRSPGEILVAAIHMSLSPLDQIRVGRVGIASILLHPVRSLKGAREDLRYSPVCFLQGVIDQAGRTMLSALGATDGMAYEDLAMTFIRPIHDADVCAAVRFICSTSLGRIRMEAMWEFSQQGEAFAQVTATAGAARCP